MTFNTYALIPGLLWRWEVRLGRKLIRVGTARSEEEAITAVFTAMNGAGVR